MVIVPYVGRKDQKRLFEAVLDHLAAMIELPVNKLVEVLENGSVHERDWFGGEFDHDPVDHPSWGR